MQPVRRLDDEGVASTVATMMVLLVVLVLLSIMVVDVAPGQQYTAEWVTSEHDLGQFDMLRSMAAGPAVAGVSFSVPFTLGTPAVSPFAATSAGTLSYSANDTTGLSISYAFVPSFRQASVRKINQDVVLLMDNSGSMSWNDPSNLRITGAQQYVGRLTKPDCVAIVAFNGRSYLTLTNVGGPAHHLTNPAMCGVPEYSLPQSDLGTISDVDSTNIGLAIQTGNNELIANGHAGKAWVEILLTDGQNECGGSTPPCGDAYTISMAQTAKAHNITIFTIGLSRSADAALLSQIASITGGTYYPAPTASSIRWIYYEISMRYESSVQCSTIAVNEAYGGSLSLELDANQYRAQTMRFESGGVALIQSDGAVMHEGVPFAYGPRAGDAGIITIPLLEVIGTPFEYSGTGTRVVQANVLARQVIEQNITRISLGAEAASVGGIAANVTYWANQGAATPSAAAAVDAPLNLSRGELLYADGNATRGDILDAKFSVDRALSDLNIAIAAAESQRMNNTMQTWLAKQTEDSIRLEQCRIGQWSNWYDGLTIRVTSSAAAAWAVWFNETLAGLNAPYSVGAAGNHAVVSIHSLDAITTDRRVLDLTSA